MDYKTSTYLPRHADAVAELARTLSADASVSDVDLLAECFERSPSTIQIVAEHDGAVVGFVQVVADELDPSLRSVVDRLDVSYEVAEVARLVVDPRHRRRGVGRALLRAAATEARGLGRVPVAQVTADQVEGVGLCTAEGWFALAQDGSDDRVLRAPDERWSETGFVRAGVRTNHIGAVATGIEVATTFAMCEPGRPGEFDYARAQNPTRKALEEALAAAEGASHAMAFSSGLAAIDAVIRLLSVGDRVVVGTDAYGGTWRLLDRVWSRAGVTVDVVDLQDPAALDAAWEETTRLCVLETPSNPTLQIVDIAAVADVVHRHRGLLLVDNTFATPWLQRPLALGADIVVHSATKYLGGHSDVVAGAVMVDDDALADEFRFVQKAVGAVPGPFDAFLVLRGLRTLPLRVDRQCANALEVARFLEQHPAIARVHYPGLESHPGHALAGRQMRGYGGMVSACLAGGEAAARTFVARTRLFTLAESLGAVESLIEHPASMTHQANVGSPLEVDPSLVRLSVGVESIGDLLTDLRQALVR